MEAQTESDEAASVVVHTTLQGSSKAMLGAYNLFRRCGRIVSVERRQRDGAGGFVVTFARTESAQQAVVELNGSALLGTFVRVTMADASELAVTTVSPSDDASLGGATVKLGKKPTNTLVVEHMTLHELKTVLRFVGDGVRLHSLTYETHVAQFDSVAKAKRWVSVLSGTRSSSCRGLKSKARFVVVSSVT